MASRGKQFDVLIVGGGPAGIAASVSAAQARKRVAIVDDNPAFGGQIWRAETAKSGTEAAAWIAKLETSEVEMFPGTRVFDAPAPAVLRAESAEGSCEFEYGKLILATGARERFLPFPGWTLPNVVGAGALQALVKSGLPIRVKRVVVAGTGPLLLAVAACLRKQGAVVAAICEQASRASLSKFALSLLVHPGKIFQAFELRKHLAGVRLITGAWPTAAAGSHGVESVTVAHDGMQEQIACDYLACGFHLVPNTELASLLGCRLDSGFVQVDLMQSTSVANVYCAGEPTGIGGVELALLEGQIAGLAAIGRDMAARDLWKARGRLRSFARRLEKAFELRPELKRIVTEETIVCRCEDVSFGQIRRHGAWRAAKLQSRCGMGPCQGRVCGPAIEFLLDWAPDSVRPPIFPTKLENLTFLSREQSTQFASAK